MSSPGWQLATDGREIPVERVRRRPLSPLQSDVVRILLEAGELRTSAVGRIAHVHRGRRGCVDADRQLLGCCRHAGAAGLDVLEPMERAGIVRHVGRGRWRLVVDP